MRNIEKLRDYFLGKDPQLKETLADNSLRLIGIPGREYVLRIELLRRLGELKKELTDKDAELLEMINNIERAEGALADRVETNEDDIAALNQWKNNTDFVLPDDLAAALLNYYTKAEVDALIAAIPTLTYEVVQALPTTNISRRTIYMVHPQGAEEPDYYNEYIYMGDTSQPYDPDNWELIGNTRIDLTNYYTKDEVDAELAERDDAIEDVADDLDVVAQHLDDVEEEVDDLYAQIPTATATDNPINVQDSSNLPIVDFAMLGNATQQTYTGKNLLPSEFRQGNTTSTTASNRLFTTNGAYLKANETYIISTNINTSNFYWATRAASQQFPANADIETGNWNTTTSLTYTPTQNCYLGIIIGKRDLNATISVSDIENTYFQVETGSTATSYEPYVGGTPAPNPDYPQDIHVVTGDNTVVVNGKNLVDISDRDKYSLKTDGTIDTYYDVRSFHTNEYSPIFSNTITLSYKALATMQMKRMYLIYYDKNLQPLNLSQTLAYDKNVTAGNTYTNTYTINNANIAYFRITANGFYKNSVEQEIGNEGVLENLISEFQIEIGSTATTYEPYTEQTQLLSLGSIELAKIGNYTDRIFKDSGKWYVEKAINKVTFNGSESWSTWGNVNTCIGFYSSAYVSNALRYNNEAHINGMGLTNKFTESDARVDIVNGNIEAYKMCGGNGNPYLAIGIDKTRLSGTTANDFKTWLSSNNTTLYYILATPTTTPIEDTTLIAQLENILKMHTNKNVTNISIVPTGTNAEPTAEVEYRVEVKAYENFTGTNGTTAGTSGLVPAPATTDSGKYLKADGTWGTPSGGGGGTSDYTELTNKPQINNVVLAGNKTTSDLGITIPTQTSDLTNDSGFITSADVPTAVSELTNDSGFVTNTVNDLTNYTPTASLAAVATSGDYDDLSNKPTIPTITYGTTDLTPGTSALDTGSFYFVYE